jgi:hypothetical protein
MNGSAYNGIVSPGGRPTTYVATGTDRPPWVQTRPLPIRYARTWIVASGPQLLRAADATK